MLRAEGLSLNFQVYGGLFSWKIYTVERDPQKLIKLANQNLSLKQYALISYLPKKKKKNAINQ